MRNVDFYRAKWKEIHTNGARVVRGEISHRDFCLWMRTVPEELPCSKCRRHAREYIHEHPPEEEPNSFRWGWEFHNAVNWRKRKPLVDYTSAAEHYSV